MVLTPIGEEHGAATKSETAALAALLALGGLISTEARAVDRVMTLLHDTVVDESCIVAVGFAAGAARRQDEELVKGVSRWQDAHLGAAI